MRAVTVDQSGWRQDVYKMCFTCYEFAIESNQDRESLELV